MSDSVEFPNCYAEAETAKALLVKIEGFPGARWVPKSQIHEDSEVFDEDDHRSGTLVVKQWWAEKEGLV